MVMEQTVEVGDLFRDNDKRMNGWEKESQP